jgi:hypothetical protein
MIIDTFLKKLLLREYKRKLGDRLERDKFRIILNYFLGYELRIQDVAVKAAQGARRWPENAPDARHYEEAVRQIREETEGLIREYPWVVQAAGGIPLHLVRVEGRPVPPEEMAAAVDSMKEQVFRLDAYLGQRERTVGMLLYPPYTDEDRERDGEEPFGADLEDLEDEEGPTEP